MIKVRIAGLWGRSGAGKAQPNGHATCVEDIFSRTGWLSSQPGGFRSRVLAACETWPKSASAAIYRQGGTPNGIYGVCRGMVALSIRGPGLEDSLVEILRPGAWFGGSCFLMREPHRFTAGAWKDCLLLHLPISSMEEIAAEDAENVRRFGKLAMEGLDSAHRALTDLLLRLPAQRVAAALARAAEGMGDNSLNLTQKELGAMGNVSRKVVNQSLSLFARRNWVRIGYRRIQIIDAAGLRRFIDDPEEATTARLASRMGGRDLALGE